jgi:hypothetical protein
MAPRSKDHIEPIRMLVEENGERFVYTFSGVWLVGAEDMGTPDPEFASDLRMWSIARSERGKLVAYCRKFARDASGTIIIAESHKELEGKVPACVFEELEIALGVRQAYRPPERPLDV